MKQKLDVQETIFRGSKWGFDGWPPEDAAGFMAWFQERFDRIPPEHLGRAKIEIDVEHGYYGESGPTIEITYLRPETDEQYASRLAREQRDALAKERRRIAEEKALLAKLLAKHGRP